MYSVHYSLYIVYYNSFKIPCRLVKDKFLLRRMGIIGNSEQSIMYIVHCTLYTAKCTQYAVLGTIYTVHHTMYADYTVQYIRTMYVCTNRQYREFIKYSHPSSVSRTVRRTMYAKYRVHHIRKHAAYNVRRTLCNSRYDVRLTCYLSSYHSVGHTVWVLQCGSYTVGPTGYALLCRPYWVCPIVYALQCIVSI